MARDDHRCLLHNVTSVTHPLLFQGQRSLVFLISNLIPHNICGITRMTAHAGLAYGRGTYNLTKLVLEGLGDSGMPQMV